MEPNTTGGQSHIAMISSIIIVLAVIVIGFFAIKQYKEVKVEQETQTTQTQDNYVKSQTDVSESTDLNSIESDLDMTDIDNLGEGL